MAWNNRYETKKFNKEQEKLAAKYRAVGMSEEAIEDESQSPMNKKFLDRFSVTIEHSDMKSRYWWIEELDNPHLAKKARELSQKQLELITLYVYEDFTVRQIASEMDISKSTVSQRINKIKKYLENFSESVDKKAFSSATT